MQIVPLPEEQELGKAVKPNVFFQPAEGFRDCFPFSEFQIFFPGVPGFAAVFFFQRHKQRVVRQPPVVLRPESGEPAVGVPVTAEGQPQNLQPLAANPAEIQVCRIIAPVKGIKLLMVQQSFLRQKLQIDQKMVSGKGGKALVRRISVARGAQRQNLPVTLSRAFQKVNECIGILTHGADTMAAGQTADVHQNAAAAHRYTPCWFVLCRTAGLAVYCVLGNDSRMQ